MRIWMIWKFPKKKENLIQDKEKSLSKQKLATIHLDAPIEISLEDVKYEGKDTEKLIDFYKEMDFKSHLDKLDTSEYTQQPGRWKKGS